MFKETKTFLGLLILILFSLTACDSMGHRHHFHHKFKKTVKIEKLKPHEDLDGSVKGAYAYKDNDNVWWIYWFVMNDTSNLNSSNPYYLYNNTIPSGGSWGRMTNPPDTSSIISEEEENLPENQFGEPQTEQEFENNTETEASSSDSESSDTGSSDSGDSGSSDSGGGDGGGE